jgi:hypothetical protein
MRLVFTGKPFVDRIQERHLGRREWIRIRRGSSSFALRADRMVKVELGHLMRVHSLDEKAFAIPYEVSAAAPGPAHL